MILRKLFFTLCLSVLVVGNSQAETPCEIHDYESVECTRYLAEQGNVSAQYNLGVMYDNGIGVFRDYGKAMRWYRIAAERGDASAQYNLGVMYENGRGVLRDDREAVRWYRMAAEQGNVSAQYNLGVMYNNIESVLRDEREAARWYHMAAEQGNVLAQYNLGVMYSSIESVLRDDREAARWYRMAAEQGYASAQNNLGAMYADGIGVLQDYGEAVRWYRMAVEQGYAFAQNNLGVMYDEGRGVLLDDREAVRWYRMAAEQGLALAQYNLSAMYFEGTGVVKNEYEAYIWLSIAKVSGDEEIIKNLPEIKWRLYLNTSEIKNAKREVARRLEEINNRQARNDNSAPVYANEPPVAITPQNKSTAETVFENAWRSVVVIKTSEAQGSGIIVRPNIVATNCHVIDGGGDIVVFKHDNRQASTDTLFSATVHRRDDENDFCLLDVAGLRGTQPFMRKYDTLNIGENVYALGSPEGLDLSLSTGIVSQLREGANSRYIQTDAAFSPGSSGGGLFDSQGNLIGILTKKLTTEGAEGLGFAIPADLILAL